MATIEVLGMTMATISPLGEGWWLAVHPNGPCITNGNSVAVLEYPSTGETGLPESVRYLAVQRYREWSWPVMKNQPLP